MTVSMSPEWIERYVQGYQEDVAFRDRWEQAENDIGSRDPERRFVRDENGLLFFRDVDHQPRLCVPKPLQALVLKEAHESPFLSAHAGPEKL